MYTVVSQHLLVTVFRCPCSVAAYVGEGVLVSTVGLQHLLVRVFRCTLLCHSICW